MADPSDLAEHYSSMAFQTRVVTLGGAAAAIGISLKDLTTSAETREAVGWVLIFIPTALGALNYRYTRCYLSACIAAAQGVSDGSGADLRWRRFVDLSENPYRSEDPSTLLGRVLSRVRRFLLSWLTYLPTMWAGVILVWNATGMGRGKWAVAIALVVTVVWGALSWRGFTFPKTDRSTAAPRNAATDGAVP